jgi:hypothetical protein
METEHINQVAQPLAMDIQNPHQGSHRSKKIVIVLSVILIILAVSWIVLEIKAKRDYLRTPEGQMQLLRDSSDPVTTTPTEQKAQLDALQKSSVPTTASREQILKELENLGQKK